MPKPQLSENEISKFKQYVEDEIDRNLGARVQTPEGSATPTHDAISDLYALRSKLDSLLGTVVEKVKPARRSPRRSSRASSEPSE